MVERLFGVASPPKRVASRDHRMMVEELPALDEQHRPPQPREVQAGRRAARAGPNDNGVPDLAFGVQRKHGPDIAAWALSCDQFQSQLLTNRFRSLAQRRHGHVVIIRIKHTLDLRP